MKPYGVDVAVLIMFFCRPVQFEQVFEQVRRARPSKLYLHQDGPRPDRLADMEGILKCRDIASRIDWDCEVHRLYRDANMGCGPAQYSAEKWMFETEQMGIVLEDDIVPSQAFFLFCKELLEKYADDEGIDRICGMNNREVWEGSEADYFFSARGSIWGWASWKRVLDGWDPEYSWLDDADGLKDMDEFLGDRATYRSWLQLARERREIGLPFHETVGGFAQLANSRLLIVPKCNLVTCVGVAEEASHAPSDLRLLPQRTRRLFLMRRHEIEFPLSHPARIIRDRVYEEAITTNRLQRSWDHLERMFLIAKYGDWSTVSRKLRRLLHFKARAT